MAHNLTPHRAATAADDLRRRARWLAWLGFTERDVVDRLDDRQEGAVHVAHEEVNQARRRRVAALIEDDSRLASN